MCTSTGVFGSVFRVVLIIINLIFFMIGSTILAIACVVKWSPTWIKDITSGELDVDDLGLGESLNAVLISLVIIGGVIILISLIGFIGTCCGSRFFLKIYEVIIGIVLLLHLIALIAAIALWSDVKQKVIKKAIDTEVNSLISKYDQNQDIKCVSYKLLAEAFECCDFNATYNFFIAVECCPESYSQLPCTNAIFAWLDDSDIYLLVANGIVLGIEFISFLSIIYILIKLKNHRKKDSSFEMDDYRR